MTYSSQEGEEVTVTFHLPKASITLRNRSREDVEQWGEYLAHGWVILAVQGNYEYYIKASEVSHMVVSTSPLPSR